MFQNIIMKVNPNGPGNSVGIETDYGLDGSGSNLGWDEILRPFSPALGPTSWIMGSGCFPEVEFAEAWG